MFWVWMSRVRVIEVSQAMVGIKSLRNLEFIQSSGSSKAVLQSTTPSYEDLFRTGSGATIDNHMTSYVKKHFTSKRLR